MSNVKKPILGIYYSKGLNMNIIYNRLIKSLILITSLVFVVGFSGCQSGDTTGTTPAERFLKLLEDTVNSAPSVVETESELDDLANEFGFDCSFAYGWLRMCEKGINEESEVSLMLHQKTFLTLGINEDSSKGKTVDYTVIFSEDGSEEGYGDSMLEFRNNEGHNQDSPTENFDYIPDIIRKILTKAIVMYGTAISNDQIVQVTNLLNSEFRSNVTNYGKNHPTFNEF
jgi:hypothetical protein